MTIYPMNKPDTRSERLKYLLFIVKYRRPW